MLFFLGTGQLSLSLQRWDKRRVGVDLKKLTVALCADCAEYADCAEFLKTKVPVLSGGLIGG
jgi:hypothetical protein